MVSKSEKRVPLYMTEEEHQKFKEKAKELGLSMNELAKKAMDRYNPNAEFVVRKYTCKKCGKEYFSRKKKIECDCGGELEVDKEHFYLIYQAKIEHEYRVIKTGDKLQLVDEDGNISPM